MSIANNITTIDSEGNITAISKRYSGGVYVLVMNDGQKLAEYRRPIRFVEASGKNIKFIVTNKMLECMSLN